MMKLVVKKNSCEIVGKLVVSRVVGGADILSWLRPRQYWNVVMKPGSHDLDSSTTAWNGSQLWNVKISCITTSQKYLRVKRFGGKCVHYGRNCFLEPRTHKI